MTERQLVKMGFAKVRITAEESGTSEGCYYYALKIGDVELISNTNVKPVHGQWVCYILFSNEIEIVYAFSLQMLISVLKQSLKNEHDKGTI